MKKRKLTEYHISVPAKLEFVKLIYRKFLKDDPYWHFAMEVTYIEIRTSGDNLKLEKFLKKNKWEFEKHPYKNNTPITRKYQSCFDDIYHGYAMLAMTLPEIDEMIFIKTQDTYRVMERCIHLAFNNFGYKLGGERGALWMILADRTYMAGYNAHKYENLGKERK